MNVYDAFSWKVARSKTYSTLRIIISYYNQQKCKNVCYIHVPIIYVCRDSIYMLTLFIFLRKNLKKFNFKIEPLHALFVYYAVIYYLNHSV